MYLLRRGIGTSFARSISSNDLNSSTVLSSLTSSGVTSPDMAAIRTPGASNFMTLIHPWQMSLLFARSSLG